MKRILTILLIITGGLINNSYSQDFYDVNTINTIEITFQESNWDYLLDQLAAAGDEERLLGSVEINGEVFDSVGVRYKGNSTYNANQIKNPFNIKLDYVIDDQTIEGYGTLKLANVAKDPSFVREVLSYEIARKYFPAGGSNYANVYVNGSHLGLYTSDQSVDKFFMQNNFGSDENTRVKGELTSSGGGTPSGGVWEYFGTDSASYANYYDMKSDYGWDELIDFLDILNNNNEDVEEVLNIDRHLWFLAFSNLLVNLDGPINNPQNYYLYKDDNGRFNPIPWDLNESFGGFTSHQTLGNLNTYQLQRMTPFANLNESEFPVISKILTNDTYMKMYVAHMKTIIDENFSDDQYETRALEIQDIINDDVLADQNKFYTYNDFINNINSQIGGGGPQGSVIGITQLMETRTDYILNLGDFSYDAPAISNVSHSPSNIAPGTEIWFNAEVGTADDVMLAYRTSIYGVFEKITMYDDGNHEDGSAGDGVYGVSLIAGSTDMQYYIYAENTNAVAFMPVRAEYEFYEISITGDLVINEFMADNESFITDEYGDYDDWIEFYNNSDEEINLEGYYLSDDSAEPDKWIFPDTTIAGGGYLIVWADKDDEQEGLHADIKLSSEGEMVVLSDPDLNIVDEVSFGIQKADTTTGRYPNGTGNFMEMLPTFAAENSILTDVEDNWTSEIVLSSNYPNPFRETTNIEFYLDNDTDVVLDIYNNYGQKITTLVSTHLSSGNHSYQWNASNQPSGIYIYTLRVDGIVHTNKMVVQ